MTISTSASISGEIINGPISPSPTPSETDIPQQQQAQSSDKSGISPGAYAGIGAGAAVGGIAILTLAILLWRKRHRAAGEQQNQQLDPQSPPPHLRNWTYPNPGIKELPGYAQSQELGQSHDAVHPGSLAGHPAVPNGHAPRYSELGG